MDNLLDIEINAEYGPISSKIPERIISQIKSLTVINNCGYDEDIQYLKKILKNGVLEYLDLTHANLIWDQSYKMITDGNNTLKIISLSPISEHVEKYIDNSLFPHLEEYRYKGHKTYVWAENGILYYKYLGIIKYMRAYPCNKSKIIEIPRDVYGIHTNCFSGCKNIEEIHLKSISVPSVRKEAFKDIDLDSCKLFVPAAQWQEYLYAEGWGEFAIIEKE